MYYKYFFLGETPHLSPCQILDGCQSLDCPLFVTLTRTPIGRILAYVELPDARKSLQERQFQTAEHIGIPLETYRTPNGNGETPKSRLG
jgi:hypothetical protein